MNEDDLPRPREFCLACKQRHEDSEVASGDVTEERVEPLDYVSQGHAHDWTVYSQHFSCEAGHQWTTRWRKRCRRYDCYWPLGSGGPGPVPGSGELE